jgi:alcohol dehydrogenase YqhD (iron-dependent ADH family)
MVDFVYPNKVTLVMGKGRRKGIGELIKPYGKRVLFVHYGENIMRTIGVYDDVIGSLRDNGLDYLELGGVQPNPRKDLVNEGIELAKAKQIDFILAVGGGSVIDTAKAISIGCFYDGDVWDIFSQFLPAEGSIPVGVLLTIPASGSESSMGAVLSNEETNEKILYGDPHLYPVFSVIDPELFCTLPDRQLAYGVSDMMSHAMERYFTSVTKTDLSDGMAETIMRSIMRCARRLKRDKSDVDNWGELALAANLAHNGLLGLGRIPDWSVHNIEHELSGIYDVPHGAGIAVLTPAWMRYVYKQHLPVFVQFAVRVMGIETGLRDQETVALQGIEALEEFFHAMGLPAKMSDLGLSDDSAFAEIALKAVSTPMATGNKLGNLQKLGQTDIEDIFRLAQ